MLKAKCELAIRLKIDCDLEAVFEEIHMQVPDRHETFLALGDIVCSVMKLHNSSEMRTKLKVLASKFFARA